MQHGGRRIRGSSDSVKTVYLFALLSNALRQTLGFSKIPLCRICCQCSRTTNFGETAVMERTFILLKPDCVERRLAGRILARFEDKGLNVVALKMLRITPELSKQHYAEHVSKPFYPALEKFITGGPVIAAVVEGLEVIRVVRDILGP